MSWFMPTLNPANVAEYLSFGEYGLALSRYSGTWVGFKAISETVESGQSVEIPEDRVFDLPPLDLPPGGLHIRHSDLPSAEIETRMVHKLRAVERFVEANPIDRRIYDLPDARFGIVTTGKGHLDLMEALRLLGLDEAACRRLGIDIYKVGMVWPLARRDALAFVRGKQEVLVVEEKRGIIESQFKEYFYDWPGDKPEKMVGKHRAAGDPLVPWTGELSPRALVQIVAERLDRFFPDEGLIVKARALTEIAPPVLSVPGANRTPYFCSGCPHNSSTKVPDGSQAASGIGCHVMASWMDRETLGFAQMGGEGVPHAVASKYTGGKHIFQNLGEGTWYHSGSLAIRQAVAAQANITYKILYNDAVAMTGGQPVDGPVSVAGIAHSCRAEGVARIALVSDDISKFRAADFPADISFHDRGDLDQVQRDLREVKGVSVLIYEQTCATEKRRRRKRDKMEDPKRFAIINPAVCEGCGDCSVESNCLSVEPLETEYGRKRKINLSTCNKDFSCLNGFCPSFVTVEGAVRRKKTGGVVDLDPLVQALPAPQIDQLARPYDLLVTGVGGTGVVTVGALITMAAHLEGKGSSVLDFTGFAQKFGTVLSYIRLARTPEDVHQVRIDPGSADAVIGCDIVVTSAPKASQHYRAGTRVVVNSAEMPTGDLVLKRDAQLHVDRRLAAIASVVGADHMAALNANHLAEALLGDSVFANVIMLGYAWQMGMVPVSGMALRQAITLNGVAIEKNARAFDLGRVLAHDPEALQNQIAPPATPPVLTWAERRDRNHAYLSQYHSADYADRYVTTLRGFETGLAAQAVESVDALMDQAVRSLFKLMAIKDEYEVARLHRSPDFQAQLDAEFEPGFKINYHLAPPLIARSVDARGRPRKRVFGPWLSPVLSGLARVRRLRGTWADPFRFIQERRDEKALITWFEDLLAALPPRITDTTKDEALAILAAPLEIRGYGPVKDAAARAARDQVARRMTAL
jgi:indolepyruvate ferredoxin oxidoreductase